MKFQVLILFLSLLLITSCKKQSSCLDGIQNGDELAVDCGGDCPLCFTCTDGMQNGSETGVDCGGDCDACPTCFDGIQNGNETGLDCGGDCQDCVTANIDLVGVWKILSHTIDGDDILSKLGINDVYHEYKADKSFIGLTVQDNKKKKTLYGDSYTINNDGSIVSRKSGVFSQSFASILSTTSLQLTHTNSDNQIEIQNFIRIDLDLCKGVNCGSMDCYFGYCL